MPQAHTFNPPNNRLWHVAFRFISSDWATLVLQVWHLLKRITTEQAVGLYEVLDFDHALELCDSGGQKAIYHKHQTVRFLQDFVPVYLDQAWGLGDIFADYHCSPGVPVDRYREGNKHRVLISLRETKRRGETMKISITRTVRNGFKINPGWSGTEISHRTKQFRTSVTFPKARHCKQATLLEKNAGRITPLGPSNIEQLPDGRQRIFWETTKPVLFETYTLKWTW